jgi:hypothetical protein
MCQEGDVTRQLVGAVFLAVAAILYAARHVGAMVLVANETGDLGEAYRSARESAAPSC